MRLSDAPKESHCHCNGTVLGQGNKDPKHCTRFEIYRIYVKDDGIYPNNEEYPTLIYKRAFDGTEADGRRMIMNDGGGWRILGCGGEYMFYMK